MANKKTTKKVIYSEPSEYLPKSLLKKHGLDSKPKTTKKPKRK